MTTPYIDWQQVWIDRKIGFHKAQNNPLLVQHAEHLKDHHHILIPLCGKTLDLHFLRQLGHRCTGIELVEQAIQEFFSEWSVSPQKSDRTPRSWTHEEITIIHQNIFKLKPEQLSQINGIYDRAALVALQPSTRQEYVDILLSLLPDGGRILLITFEMPCSPDLGPPFSISEQQVYSLYARARSTTLLETHRQTDPEIPILKSRAIDWFQTQIWLIEK